MRIRSAALGLAAVGAGLLVASLLRRKDDELGDVIDVEHSPPEPGELIGYPASRKSAADSAQVLGREGPTGRPM
ncbi:MAG TPA: hypothetical protein VLL76_00090 [Candidatus Omnitrophota bacterium]|nr:hypothetical protein [Candidatus Omnitrophota bacterium]